MLIGALRHYVDIERQRDGDATATGDNEHANDWQSIWEDVPCSIRQLSGRELEIARQLVARATHKVTIRYRPNVLVKDRLNFDGRIFGIGSINNLDERNNWLELTVTEEV